MLETLDLPISEQVSAKHLLESAHRVREEDYEQALSLAQQALNHADTGLLGQILLFIGQTHYQHTELNEALAALQQAYECLEQEPSNPLAVEALILLGRVQRDLGDLEDAEKTFLVVLEATQKIDNPLTTVESTNLLASIYDAQGKTATALKYLKESLVIAEQHQYIEQQSIILTNIGSLHLSLGNYPNALEALSKANYFMQPNTRNEAINLMRLGQLYDDMGDHRNALDFYQQAQNLGRVLNDSSIEITSTNNLANLHLQTQSWQLAKEGFESALQVAQKSGLKQFEIDNLDGLGQVYVALGNVSQAIENHIQALQIARDIGDSEGEIEALLNLGRDHLAAQQPQEALEFLQQVLDFSMAEYPKTHYEAHASLSTTYEELGELNQALHYYKTFHTLKDNFFNEENKRKTRELSVQFDVDRIHRQAEEYRLRNEISQAAKDEAEKKVQERTKDLEAAQLEIVNRLALAGEYRDDDTGEHTRRVGRNSAILAYMLGWSEQDVQIIYSAARLHDVGKIGISDTILLKPGKLTQDEMTLMRTHTSKGASILSGGQSKLLRMAEEIAAYHHERWNGTGYPYGLAGATIPQSARIVAVADVLDALIHERPYKKAWSLGDALREIESLSATHFDPLVVEMCLRIFRDNPLFSPSDIQNDWESTRKNLSYLQLKNS